MKLHLHQRLQSQSAARAASALRDGLPWLVVAAASAMALMPEAAWAGTGGLPTVATDKANAGWIGFRNVMGVLCMVAIGWAGIRFIFKRAQFEELGGLLLGGALCGGAALYGQWMMA